MRIGVTVPLATGDTREGHVPTFEETALFAARAEELGLDSIWVFDHLIFRFPPDADEGLREAWTTLAALAVTVPRVELGTLVMCASFRNPAVLAKMAATLDDLSGGRLLLGLGAGWHDPEYEAFGFPTDHRVSRFEEDLEVTVRLLRGERVELDGRWRRYRDAVLIPPPRRPTPVLVAAKGRRMLRATARWADAWNTAWFGAVDDRLRDRLAALDAACGEVGRDPSTIRRTVGIRLHDPGTRGDDATGTDAESEALATFFDELAALRIDDAIVWSLSKSPEALERIAAAREMHLRKGAA
jgi:alkanesulfonate monooxygenase SsuD/methylene tetrahydromethanopterin reductase-like flavin-dependent oxidoreductase (luciferase family)